MSLSFPFPVEIEHTMKVWYRSLRENDRRRYAALEAAKLERGGDDYIAQLLGCDPKTIRRGQLELEQMKQQPLDEITPAQRIRKPGGGAKRL